MRSVTIAPVRGFRGMLLQSYFYRSRVCEGSRPRLEHHRASQSTAMPSVFAVRIGSAA
jgi:hypothetical protein